MPHYDFRCHECATVFEVRRSMSRAAAPAACPECNSDKTYKLLSHVSILGNVQQQSTQAANSGGGCGCGSSCACAAH